MIYHRAIWHAAALLLSRRGPQAVDTAQVRVQQAREEGDHAGQCVWAAVLEALTDILRERPEFGDQIH
jgi:hypothetical protein